MVEGAGRVSAMTVGTGDPAPPDGRGGLDGRLDAGTAMAGIRKRGDGSPPPTGGDATKVRKRCTP